MFSRSLPIRAALVVALGAIALLPAREAGAESEFRECFVCTNAPFCSFELFSDYCEQECQALLDLCENPHGCPPSMEGFTCDGYIE